MRAIPLIIDPSQFPGQVQADLIHGLNERVLPSKFHYDSPKQTLKWLALHEAHSPARTDPDCRKTYARAFAETAEEMGSVNELEIVGLGCGGGQKDRALIEALLGLRQGQASGANIRSTSGRAVRYLACDVSPAMVVTALGCMDGFLDLSFCRAYVCDLAQEKDFTQFLLADKSARRIFTFFGMLPNFEPGQILPKLRSWLRPEDLLLFSANLAPGPDYAKGTQAVLPSYENELTRDWLMTLLFDLGFERGDGALKFQVEEAGALKRIAVSFQGSQPRRLSVYGQPWFYDANTPLAVFYSYRHQPRLAAELFTSFGFRVRKQWITKSEEEGVFLAEIMKDEL